MNISKENVSRIARLARIELAPQEEEKFQKELSEILDFVEELNKVETKNIPPMAGGTTAENIVRSDEQKIKDLELRQALLLEAAPDSKDGWIKVKSVFHAQ